MISHLSIHHSVEAIAKQVTSTGSPANTLDFAVSHITIREIGRSTEERVYHPAVRFSTKPLLLTQTLQEQAEAAEISLVYKALVQQLILSYNILLIFS